MMQQNKLPILDLTQCTAEAHQISQQLITCAAFYQQRCLLLIDPFLSPLHDSVLDYFAGLNQLYVVRIMHAAVLAAKRPLLIAFDLSDLFQQQALTYLVNQALTQLSADYIAYGYGQQYAAWLFTQAPASQIAADLAKLALQKQQTKTLLLRFYDPAIFPQLISRLTTSQQKKLYGQITDWAILTADRQLHIIANPGATTQVLSGQLGLSDTQLTELYIIGINNQLIQSQRLNDPTLSLDVIASLNQIMPSLKRLLAKSIRDENLLVEWARIAFTLGADFDLQPGLQTRIQKLTQSQQYYAILNELQALSSDDWQLLVTGGSNE